MRKCFLLEMEKQELKKIILEGKVPLMNLLDDRITRPPCSVEEISQAIEEVRQEMADSLFLIKWRASNDN